MTGYSFTSVSLPFVPAPTRRGGRPDAGTKGKTSPLTFLNEERSIQFGLDGSLYKCSLEDYTCAKVGPIPNEDRRAGDKPVRTRPGDGADVIDLDATVDLETDFPARARDHGVDAFARERELVQCLVDERLSRKARVHRHDQDDVELVENMIEAVERRRRVDRQHIARTPAG